MKTIFHEFYVQPMNLVYVETISAYLLWTVVMLLFGKKARRIIGSVGVILSMGLIVLFTVYGRLYGGTNVVRLIPFITIVNAQRMPELYRTMYMNGYHCRVLVSIFLSGLLFRDGGLISP